MTCDTDPVSCHADRRHCHLRYSRRRPSILSPGSLLWQVDSTFMLHLFPEACSSSCAAAKHIRGLAKKTRIWSLLDDVEMQLGFHTRSRVRKLQQLVETTL